MVGFQETFGDRLTAGQETLNKTVSRSLFKDMLTCSVCKIEKTEANFADKSSAKKQSHCRDCGNSYTREHYKANKAFYLERNKRRKLEVKRKIFEYLKLHQCIDCGEKETLYLDFDHKNPAEKLFSIGTAVAQGAKGWKTIIDEIAKCDIRCVKCHRKRTAEQFNWFKFDQR